MNIGVLLSGSGVYDGSEIHEAVFTLLSIEKNGGDAICFAPNIDQHHVINHLNGEELEETRNVLIESARITRGNIRDVEHADTELLDALVIPGGFGAAKNLSKWAIDGPSSEINSEVRKLIIDMIAEGKPVVGLCMGPTVIAKAVQGTGMTIKLTVGTTEEHSPYDIAEISEGLTFVGAESVMQSIDGIVFDEVNNVITAPCYMMDATISEVNNNVNMAIDKLFEVLKS
ncbi:isoprenoid biosynthesis glyoxalase ElbB [Candidatus Kapabacteria bacterium]|nr:isoprenoid biosynthesis glyoxalase ElbB [Candidatus Kapabacteria bacterium]